MAEKFIVEPFAQFYALRRSDRSNAGTIDNLADAHLFAASPLMLEALEVAYSKIFRLITQSRMIQELNVDDSGDVLKAISAAIAAAKGE
jgi:hypothetical protein